MIYLITDTHKRDLNLKLKDNDILIHLGDYESGIIGGRFKKILIIGNHDTKFDEFDFACEGLLFKNTWFTHEPAERLPKDAYTNICGHLHNNKFSDFGFEEKSFNMLLEPDMLYRFIKYNEIKKNKKDS